MADIELPEPSTPTSLVPVSTPKRTPDFRFPVTYDSPFSGAADGGFLYYLKILNKRRWIVAATLILSVSLIAIVTLKAVPIYEAVGRIALNHENSDVLGFKGAGLYDPGNDAESIALDTQLNILKSDAVALATAQALGFDKDPGFRNKSTSSQESALTSYIQSNLKLSVLPRTRIIEIRFSDPNPQTAAHVVNTLVNVYIEQNYKTRYESAMQTSDWLSKQLADLQVKVETSQQKLVEYQKEHGILGIDEKQNIVTAKLDELNRELTAAEADRIQKESRYRLSMSGNPELIINADFNTLLGRLHQQEADLKSQLAQAEVQLGPAHPRIREINNQMLQVQAGLRAELEKLGARIKTDFQAASQRESMLRTAMEAQKQQANALNESAIQYSLLKRDVETNRQLYEGLLQKLKEASVSAGLKSSTIRVVDAARVPLAPARPDKRRNLMTSLALGLIGGVVLAFLVEAIDDTVTTPEQAQDISGMPALGVIPIYRKAAMRTRHQLLLAESNVGNIETVVFRQPNSDVAEAYRALRTALLLSSSGSPPQVIMITSPHPQEGKTTTCINTALVLAQSGARVLLIDADLRRPRIHGMFNITPKRGLSTLLTGGSDPGNSILKVPQLSGLHLLPAGPPRPHPAELLGSKLMKRYIEDWRQQFDYIIFDTPPAVSVNDSVPLSADMDAVMLVVRSGQTKKGALRRASHLLRQVNARVLGVVVNGMDIDSGEYGDHYYYGSKYSDYHRYSET